MILTVHCAFEINLKVKKRIISFEIILTVRGAVDIVLNKENNFFI
jgi:hypothetical protein